MTPTEIRREFAGLSLDEKIQLVEDLWDDIALTPEDLPLPVAQRKELGRRIEDFNRNPHEGTSWEQAKREIRQRK
ncbi:MAG: addiction module protein [Verrucomicrobiota bacterium]